VPPYAKVLHWNNEDTSVSWVLLKILVEDTLDITRSLVIKLGRESDGGGRSWTMLVYIFNSNIVSAGPADEDDPLTPPPPTHTDTMGTRIHSRVPFFRESNRWWKT
jgi:hypothetical protein